MFSRIFIERPKLAMVISIVMVLAGAICMTRIPIAEYPEIAPPQIMVIAQYPGASSEVVADTIAAPIESEIVGVEDMLYFSSESNNDGSYALSITFEPGTDTDMAQVNVQNAVKRAEAKLPEETRTYGINIIKRSSDMLGVFVFTLDENAKDNSPIKNVNDLGNYLRMHVKDEVARINGISQAEIMGASDYAMRVWLDPLKMSAEGISPTEVAAAIQAQNIQAAAGAVGSEFSNDMIQLKVNALGRLKSVEEFSDINVRTTSDGRNVKLKDVAKVELGAEDYSWSCTADNKPVVLLAIYRNDDANAINVVDKAKEVIADASKHFPAGMSYHMGYDPTKYIRQSMHEIVFTLILTLVLVVGITYLFLQNWRATLIPALTIPVSIMGTFIFLYPLGFSMNLLTMFALILVIGSLVDDAIVVTENVIRIMDEEHLSAKEATIKGMTQITGAVIATTLVILAIYVPIGFYGGMVGTIYIQFSVTMCIALCLSTVNALTLSPALCSILIKPAAEKKLDFFKPFNKLLGFSKNVFLRCTGFMVRRALITVVLFAAIVLGNYLIFKNMHTSFLPAEDKGALLVAFELPPGATLARTQEVQREFFARVRGVEGIKEITSIAGFSFFGGKGENLGLSIIALKDWEFRTSPETQIDVINEKVQALSSDIADASVFVAQPPAIMGLGATNDVTCVIQALEGQSAEELETAARTLMILANDKSKAPEIAMGFSQYNASTPQLFLDINRDKAKMMKVPVSRIFTSLQSELASLYINDFNLNGFSFKVKIQSENSERNDLNDIEHILVANDDGKMVPLTSFTDIRYELGPRVVTRFNQMRCADFRASGMPGVSSHQVMQRIQKLVDDNLPGYQLSWKGQSFQERGNEGKIGMLMTLALIFAYLFLVGQYESWTMPSSVILSVAVATLGALAGLWVCGMSLSIYAQLGLIMLIGLSGKNAILMAEFSKMARESGDSIYDAAQNGGSVRYRAVLMTAWSFVIGVFPMVVATGAGAGSRRAIGVTTFYGMVLASIVGIVFVPPIWALFQRLQEKIHVLVHGKDSVKN